MLKISLKPSRKKIIPNIKDVGTSFKSDYLDGNNPSASADLPTIKIVTQFFPPDYAATGQLVEELAVQFSAEDMRVGVFTSQPSYAFDDADALPKEQRERLFIRRTRISRLWAKRVRGKTLGGLVFCLRASLNLLRFAHRTDVVVITTAPPFLPVVAWLISLLTRMPYVCLLYDLYPDIIVQLGLLPKNHWLTRLWNQLNCYAWKRSKAVIVLSSTMKERVVAKCPEVADKTVVIHNWANPEHIQPIPKQENWFAHQHNLVDQFTVLYSGNMGRCHDMDTIMVAANHLRHDPVLFVFIGDGAKQRVLQQQAQQLKLNNLLFLPYQDRNAIPYSLTACDLSLVSIDTGMEGLVVPSKLYSGLAAGRPIAAVCEQHSYLNGLIHQAQCGAAFRNGDGAGLADFIRELSKHPQRASLMGSLGRQYFQANFTPDVIARQYFSVLNPEPPHPSSAQQHGK